MKKLLFSSILATMLLAGCGSNEAPVVSISTPDNDLTFAIGDEILLSGTATDDTEVTAIELSSGTPGLTITSSVDVSTVADVTSIPFNFNLDLVDFIAGTYSVVVTATDDEGETGSETLTFTVQ